MTFEPGSSVVETPAKPSFRAILTDRAIGSVIVSAFVMMIGFGVTAPTLPLFARSFGVGYGAVGALISGFGLSRLVFDLVAGPLVDRFGERRCAGLGLTFVALCALATGLAPTFPVAFGFWALGGAGSAVAFAAFFSYLIKVVPQAQMARTLGIFYGAFNMGIIAGGPLGGFLGERFGVASPLFAYTGLASIAGLIFWRFVPVPRRAATEPPDLETIAAAGPNATWLRRLAGPWAELLRLPSFITVVFLNLAYLWFVTAVFDTLIPLFGSEELGMSTAAIGAVFAIAVATEFFVLYPAGSLADRFGRKPVLMPSLLGLAAIIVALGFAPTVVVYVVLIGVLGITSGFAGVPPAAMLSDLVPPERSGTGIGLFRFCGDLGFFLGPLIAGVSANSFGFQGAFAIAALPVVVALVLVVRTPETLGRRGLQEPEPVRDAAQRKKNDTDMMT